MTDYPYTIFSGIGFLVCIPVALFHWKIHCPIWATRFFIGWIFIVCLLAFVDSILWAGNDLSTWWDRRVYCDITIYIKAMAFVGIPGASIGICRVLGDIINSEDSKTDLLRGLFVRNLIDLFLSFLLPLTVVALSTPLVIDRYHINGVLGCTATGYVSWISIFVCFLWSPIFCLISAAYNCIFPTFTEPKTTVRFIWNWWLRRRRYKRIGSAQLVERIADSKSRIVIVTFAFVTFLYMPLSTSFALAHLIYSPKLPFSFRIILGLPRKDIVLQPMAKAPWRAWIPITLPFALFALLGLSKSAKQFYYEWCIWIYEHIRKMVHGVSSFMRGFWEICKKLVRRTGSNPDNDTWNDL